MGFFDAKQTGTNTSTSSSAPWQPQQPYLQDLYSKAQTEVNKPATSGGMNFLTGMQSGALNTPLTGQASGVIQNTLTSNPAENFGIGVQNQYQGQTTTPIGQFSAAGVGNTQSAAGVGRTGDVSNPYLQSNNPWLNASINQANEDTTRAMMPQIAAANRSSGSFGNSGVAETYGRALADQYGRNATGAQMQDYGQRQALTGQQQQFNAGLSEANFGRQQQNNQYNSGLQAADLARQQQNNQYNANLGFGASQANAGLQQADISRNAGLDQTRIANDNSQYNLGVANQNNAAFNAPAFTAGNMANIGTAYNTQAAQNDARLRQLQGYGSLVTGGGGSTSSTSSPIYSNNGNTLLGAAGVAGSLYNNIFGSGSK